MIDGKNVRKNIRKTAISQGDDYTNGCLID